MSEESAICGEKRYRNSSEWKVSLRDVELNSAINPRAAPNIASITTDRAGAGIAKSTLMFAVTVCESSVALTVAGPLAAGVNTVCAAPRI
jgi:hypothetical protein